jgi:hypothetical protein
VREKPKPKTTNGCSQSFESRKFCRFKSSCLHRGAGNLDGTFRDECNSKSKQIFEAYKAFDSQVYGRFQKLGRSVRIIRLQNEGMPPREICGDEVALQSASEFMLMLLNFKILATDEQKLVPFIDFMTGRRPPSASPNQRLGRCPSQDRQERVRSDRYLNSVDGFQPPSCRTGSGQRVQSKHKSARSRLNADKERLFRGPFHKGNKQAH